MDPAVPPVPPPISKTPTIAAPTIAPRHGKKHDGSSASEDRGSSTSSETLVDSRAATAKTSKLRATSAPFITSGVSSLAHTRSFASIAVTSSSTSPFNASTSSSTNQSQFKASVPTHHGTSSTYLSPTQVELQRLSRLHSNGSHLSFSNSPFFPQTLGEFVEHQKLYAEDVAMEGKERLVNMVAEAESGAPKVMMFMHGTKEKVRHRILGDGRSAVLGVPSIWTAGGSNPKTSLTTAGLGNITDSEANLANHVIRGVAGATELKQTPIIPNSSEGTAAWPSAVEFKLHGEDRIKKYGKKAQRTLPVPVNSLWVLGETRYERKIWEYSDLDKVALGSPVTGAGLGGKRGALAKNAAMTTNFAGAGMSGLNTDFNAASSNLAAGAAGGSFNIGFNPNNMVSNTAQPSAIGSTFSPGFTQNSMSTSTSNGNTFNPSLNPPTTAPPGTLSTNIGGNSNQSFNTANMTNSFSSFKNYPQSHAHASNKPPTTGQVVPINVANQFMPLGGTHNPFLTMTPDETPILTRNEHGQYIFSYANMKTALNVPVYNGGYGQGYAGQQFYGGAGPSYGSGWKPATQTYVQAQFIPGGCPTGMYPAMHSHPHHQPGFSIHGQAEVAGIPSGAVPPQTAKTAAGLPHEARAQSFGPFSAGEDDEEPPEGGWVFDEEWMRANGHCLEVLDAINKK